MRLPRRSTVVLLVVYVVVKAALVVALADVFFYGEELEKGAMSKALVDGLDVAPHRLSYHHYEGGGNVVSALRALAFLIVGESVLAHKLVAIATGAAVLLAGVVLARRHFGDRAAALFGLLFTFGPESFQKLALLNLGIHFEATLFVLLVLHLGLRLAFEDRDAAPRPRLAFALGLATGFGFYFNYQLALPAAWIAVVLAVVRRDAILGPAGLAGIVGTLVGALPLFAMWALVGGAVFDIHGTSVSGDADTLEQLRAFFTSSYAGSTATELAAGVLFPLAIVAAALVAPWLGERPARARAAVLAGFLAVWLAVYLNTGFVVGRYVHYFGLARFAPVWAVGTLLVAATGAACQEHPGARQTVARIAIVLLVLLGLEGSRRAITAGRPATPTANLGWLARTKGYDYEGYFAKVWDHFEGGTRRRAEILLGYDEPHRELLRMDLASVALRESDAAIDPTLEALAQVEPEGREHFALGAGLTLSRAARADLHVALRRTERYAPPLRELLRVALGRSGAGADTFPIVAEEIRGAVAIDGREDFWRGTGYRAFRAFVANTRGGVTCALKPDAVRTFLEEQPPDAVPHLLAGFDDGRRLHTLP